MLRFWDPAVAKEYFAAIADQTDQASAWGGGAKSAISRLVIPEPRAVTVVEFPTTEQRGRFPPVIDERVRLRFRQLALMRNIALLEEVIEAPRWLGIETPEVRQLVCRVIELGTRYGISGRRDIARLCNVALQLGHRFPEDVRFESWARGALTDRAVAENVRLRTCYDRAIVQLRADGSPGAHLRRLTALLETLERGTRPGTYEACRTVLGSPDTVETYQILSAFSEESLALHAATATVRWPEEVICAFSSCFGQYFKDDPSRKTWSALLEEAATIAELRSQVADRVNRWVTQYDAV